MIMQWTPKRVCYGSLLTSIAWRGKNYVLSLLATGYSYPKQTLKMWFLHCGIKYLLPCQFLLKLLI